MAIGSGSRVSMSYVAESTHGTTPGSPTMLALRTTGRNLNLKKTPLETAEVRADRQISVHRHGFKRIEGSLAFEHALMAYDDMLEGAMGSTFASGTATQVTPVSVASSKFHRATGSFLTDGYRVGDTIITAAFSASNNNGQFVATVVTATDITVVKKDGSAHGLTTESAGSQTLDLVGKRLSVGTTLKTYTFERRFEDLTQYQLFKGCAINQWNLAVQPEQIVQSTLTVLGMSDGSFSGSSLGSPVAAATNDPMTAFDGFVFEGGSIQAYLTGLNLVVANGRTVKSVIGAYTSPDVFEGRSRISGTLTALFNDATMYNKFLNETESSLWMRLNDPTDTSKFHNIVLPRVKYDAGDIDPPTEGPLMVTLPFVGLLDSVSGTQMSIQRSNT